MYMKDRDKRIKLLEQEIKYLANRVSALSEMNIALNNCLVVMAKTSKILNTPKFLVPAEDSPLDGA